MMETLTTIQIAIIFIAAAMQVILFVLIVSMHNNLKQIRKAVAPKSEDINMLLFMDKKQEAQDALLKKMYKDIKFLREEYDSKTTKEKIKKNYEAKFKAIGMIDSLEHYLDKI